jgi:hypothetical protein
MINKHINNPFLATRIGNDNFGKYSQTHIERLRTNIPETTDTLFEVPIVTVFDKMITQTEALYNDWKASTDSGATEKAQKEGKTKSVNQSFDELKSFISIKEGVIADKFHKGTPVYEEFFPLGLKEYSGVRKKNADTIFKRFINVLNIHKDVFDANMINEANEKYSTYTSLRQAQLQKIGEVKDKTSIADEKRKLLALQLYKNLLTLLLIYADKPEKAELYFDESIQKRKLKVDEKTIVKSAVAN